MRRSPCRSDEVDVQLDVLGPFVVHRVRRRIYGRDLVIVGDDGLGDATIEFTKKLTKPNRLSSSSVGDSAIFGLHA